MTRVTSCVAVLATALAMPAVARAQCTPAAPPPTIAYCGGELAPKGQSLDLTAECRRLYGETAVAALLREDAFGWVCRIPGAADRGIDVMRACRRAYGSRAIATLVGLHAFDWRCLTPDDVRNHIVPVLLLPLERFGLGENAFVQASLRRIETLMAGVRGFYGEHAGRSLRGTNAFVRLTDTTAEEWQSLAIATDHAIPGYPLDRFGFLRRVKRELKKGRWHRLWDRGAKVGGFVSLGADWTSPSGCGAAADRSKKLFSEPPSVSYADCKPGTPNPLPYEHAFYAAGHELGHTLGLDHTDEYGGVTLPPNWQQSIMHTGYGTQSLLLPFEIDELLQYLSGWG